MLRPISALSLRVVTGVPHPPPLRARAHIPKSISHRDLGTGGRTFRSDIENTNQWALALRKLFSFLSPLESLNGYLAARHELPIKYPVKNTKIPPTIT
jgi:hypothetical protein